MERSDPPEHRFLAYARTGDPAILETLLRQHADQAFTQARRMLGRSDRAEDAVQDACVRLIASASRYRGTVPFAAWFGRLVHFAALEQRRLRGRHRRGLGKVAAR